MKRQFGIIILSLLTYLNVSGQITDFVKSDSIIYQFTNQTLVKLLLWSK
jgi:hypothetical protein